ncbi:hypothetical protein L21SP3_02014 [Sedimentisphaera cyanobacteriorum]|uniref:Uncharacterized protein n=2 Tax=Sedimentisphaera cyanobacteriorum TaxID=1940790 RepID=A0A1Q2HSF4_9BACT|nr:hypothetical protein L21SP3_02014 [Sedimentisphaera cyanobacteriorum]
MKENKSSIQEPELKERPVFIKRDAVINGVPCKIFIDIQDGKTVNKRMGFLRSSLNRELVLKELKILINSENQKRIKNTQGSQDDNRGIQESLFSSEMFNQKLFGDMSNITSVRVRKFTCVLEDAKNPVVEIRANQAEIGQKGSIRLTAGVRIKTDSGVLYQCRQALWDIENSEIKLQGKYARNFGGEKSLGKNFTLCYNFPVFKDNF